MDVDYTCEWLGPKLKCNGLDFAFGLGIAELYFPPDHEVWTKDPSRLAQVGQSSQAMSLRRRARASSHARLAGLGVNSKVLGDIADTL